MNSKSKVSAFEILRIRDVRMIWFSQAIADFGDSLAALTLLMTVNKLSHSTIALAAMAVVLAVPTILVGPLAGVCADRFNRKRIMLFSDGIRALLVLAFVIVSSSSYLWLIYLIGFMQASVGAFFQPARVALVSTLVPHEKLLVMNSLFHTTRIVSNVAGASLAAIAMGTLHIAWPAFVVNSATFAISLLFISQVQTPLRVRAGEKGVSTVFEDLRVGIVTITRNRALIGALLVMGITLFGTGGLHMLTVSMLINNLRVSPGWYSVLQIAQTVGMVVSGIVVSMLGARLMPIQTIRVSALVLGTSITALSWVANVGQLTLLLLAIGLSVMPLQISIATITQSNVASEVRGRVASAITMVGSTANVLSMAVAGYLGEVSGIRHVYMYAGAVVICAAIVSLFVFGSWAARNRAEAAAALPAAE